MGTLPSLGRWEAQFDLFFYTFKQESFYIRYFICIHVRLALIFYCFYSVHLFFAMSKPYSQLILIVSLAAPSHLKDDKYTVVLQTETCHKAFGERSRHTDWMHNGDVCRLLNISKRSILQHYRDKGIIPYTQFAGKILYKTSDLERLLDEHYQE